MKNKKIVIGIITLGLLISSQSEIGVQAKKIENKLQVKQKKITMSVGEKKKIKVTAKKKFLKKLVWKSSNKKVATVNQKGVVKAKKKGTAKITVFVKKNKKIKVCFKVQVRKKITENKVKVPATTGAINVTGASVTFNGVDGGKRCLSEGWFFDKKTLQKQYNEEVCYGKEREDMTNQVLKYGSTFFDKKALYYILVPLGDSGREFTVESAVIKQDSNGEWICEVTVNLKIIKEGGDSYDCALDYRGIFLEFDKDQIEGISKVNVIVNSNTIYLPAPTGTPS